MLLNGTVHTTAGTANVTVWQLEVLYLKPGQQNLCFLACTFPLGPNEGGVCCFADCIGCSVFEVAKDMAKIIYGFY